MSTQAISDAPAGLPGKNHIAKLIIAEHDRATMELLTDHLTADRYDVLNAPTAADAIRLCENNSADLILLDLNLGGFDAGGEVGLDVLDKIRSGDSGRDSIGVILLSGRGTERDRVRGLERGADDYVVKPYSCSELLARISAVLRRRSRDATDEVVVGDIKINKAERSVKVGERNIELSNKEFMLLCKLAEEPTRVMSKEELLRDCWGYRSLGHTRTLEAHASRLRRKLDPDGTRHLISNCWGVGYRMTGV